MAASNSSKKSTFDVLNNINVNDHTEDKNGLTYLSWAWAWSEVKKVYPDANYEIVKFDGIPYAYDPNTGYMVYTRVTIEGVTHEMWLPVMDSNNRAMKAEPYQIQTKYKTIPVNAATMFDVNKTIMRCLVKNLAMFGLGLYIYAGEDIPSPADDVPSPSKVKAESVPNQLICQRCGNQIPGYNGNTPQQVANATMKAFGKVMCMECGRLTKKEQSQTSVVEQVDSVTVSDEELANLPFKIE